MVSSVGSPSPVTAGFQSAPSRPTGRLWTHHPRVHHRAVTCKPRRPKGWEALPEPATSWRVARWKGRAHPSGARELLSLSPVPPPALSPRHAAHAYPRPTRWGRARYRRLPIEYSLTPPGRRLTVTVAEMNERGQRYSAQETVRGWSNGWGSSPPYPRVGLARSSLSSRRNGSEVHHEIGFVGRQFHRRRR